MKKLENILSAIKAETVIGNTDIVVKDIQLDSRKVTQGSMFAALKGTLSDGHTFINNAIDNGAKVIVCEHVPEAKNEETVYVVVKNSHEAIACLANEFYDNPSTKVKLIGVTGTNGKTTVATILHKLFTHLGFKCGLISTVENKIGNEVIAATHTTPDAVSLNALIARMVEQECDYAFMECSSHAIHQHRITGLFFQGGIFTNITHDHLDYHKTFDEYIKVKKTFFDRLPPTAFALTNVDDKHGAVMLQNTNASKLSYSLHTVADIKGKILENELTGLLMNINNKEVHLRLIGAFNAYNILAIYGTAIAEHQDSDKVLQVLSSLTSAEGRFDYVLSKKNIIGIVDYAHTPDALQNVLKTIHQLRKNAKQVITVVGCGGDRDQDKRPIMAKEAAELSDTVILTSDNPRSENADDIIQQMEQGLSRAAKKKSLSIADRKQAIKTSVSMANEGDIILVAGKGHEKYQEINGVRNHFDDKEVLLEMFELLEK